MKQFKLFIGVVFVVASMLKLATLWGLVHISWFERMAEEPWATYIAPVVLIIVGADLIHQAVSKKQDK